MTLRKFASSPEMSAGILAMRAVVSATALRMRTHKLLTVLVRKSEILSANPWTKTKSSSESNPAAFHASCPSAEAPAN